jgi:hypothetical protein
MFCAIGMTLWSVVVCSQAALPAAVRARVSDGRWGVVTSIRGLPLGVRDELQALFGGALDIAEPGAGFRGGGDDTTLPGRRLIAAGCSYDDCLVYYERGGRTPTWHVALFHWTPAETRFEWGGLAPSGLATIDQVRNAVLSGRIKSPNAIW